MSIQKQKRQLSYNPAIIIATPGRLWELLDDRQDPFLTKSLPMIDVLVLDEADRMIADGHFKEMHKILEFIYSKRVETKKAALNPLKQQQDAEMLDKIKQGQDMLSTDLYTKESVLLSNGKNPNKIVNLGEDDDDWMNNLVVEGPAKEEGEDNKSKIKPKEQI